MLLGQHRASLAKAYKRAGYWLDSPVPNLIAESAKRVPERTALVDHYGRVTFRELHERVRRLASGLLAMGIGKGSVVAIQLPNRNEFVYFQQAVARIGCVYLPLIPQLRGRDMEFVLNASKAVALVVPDVYRDFDHIAMTEKLRPQLPHLRHLFVVGDKVSGNAIRVADFFGRDWESAFGEVVDDIVVGPDEIRALYFTSGTESKPKGVLHSYNTLTYPLRVHIRDFNFSSDDVVLVASPAGHATGSVYGVEFGVLIAAKIVFKENWNPEESVELVARERCTVMWGAPTFFADFVNASNVAEYTLSSLRVFFSGGAPCPRILVKQVQERIGCRLVVAYGSSEGGNVTISRPDDPPEQITATDGNPHPGVELKLVDADRKPLPPGEPGELAYRGPNVFLGYLDPEMTARSFDSEGFFYSGDMAVIRPDGYIRIVGRSKEIIIRGGENISPAEIEEVLCHHPKIKAVTLVGLPDERLGQRACAAIIPQDGQVITLQDVVQYLSDRDVAKFKVPERVELFSDFPRSATGKIQKNVLRDRILGNEHCDRNPSCRGS